MAEKEPMPHCTPRARESGALLLFCGGQAESQGRQSVRGVAVEGRQRVRGVAVEGRQRVRGVAAVLWRAGRESGVLLLFSGGQAEACQSIGVAVAHVRGLAVACQSIGVGMRQDVRVVLRLLGASGQ